MRQSASTCRSRSRRCHPGAATWRRRDRPRYRTAARGDCRGAAERRAASPELARCGAGLAADAFAQVDQHRPAFALLTPFDRKVAVLLRIGVGLAAMEFVELHARQFGELNDPVTRQIKSEQVQVLKPDTGNQPRVFYIVHRPSRPVAEQRAGSVRLCGRKCSTKRGSNPEDETAGVWSLVEAEKADHS